MSLTQYKQLNLNDSLQPGDLDNTQVNIANGFVILDGSGNLPASLLPASAMEFKGGYDANTETPSLANGTGDTGDFYKVTADGTVDFGAGNVELKTGDSLVYDGSIWVKIDNTDQVSSVFGRQGVVTANSSDYDAVQVDYDPTSTAAQWSDPDPTDVQDAIDTLRGDVSAATHNPITIAVDGVSDDALTLSLQEITANLATPTTDGVMSSGDKSKLNGIEVNAKDDQDAEEVSIDDTGSHYTTDNVEAALAQIGTEINALEGDQHVAITLNSGDPTQQSANLSGQELELVQATGSTDGVMSAEDKTKVDYITVTQAVNLDTIETDLTNLETARTVIHFVGEAVNKGNTFNNVANKAVPAAQDVAKINMYVNGQRQKYGASEDFTVDGSGIVTWTASASFTIGSNDEVVLEYTKAI